MQVLCKIGFTFKLNLTSYQWKHNYVILFTKTNKWDVKCQNANPIRYFIVYYFVHLTSLADLKYIAFLQFLLVSLWLFGNAQEKYLTKYVD